MGCFPLPFPMKMSELWGILSEEVISFLARYFSGGKRKKINSCLCVCVSVCVFLTSRSSKYMHKN